MNSPPSRFWPGALTPLQGRSVTRRAVGRSSSFRLDRGASPCDTISGHSFKTGLLLGLTAARLVFRSARPDKADPVSRATPRLPARRNTATSTAPHQPAFFAIERLKSLFPAGRMLRRNPHAPHVEPVPARAQRRPGGCDSLLSGCGRHIRPRCAPLAPREEYAERLPGKLLLFRDMRSIKS